MSAHGAVGRDQHARYQRDLADVQRRVRKYQAAKYGTSVRAGTGGDPALAGDDPAAFSSPQRYPLASPPSQLGRYVFGAVIAIGCAVLCWLILAVVELLGPWGTAGLLLAIAACCTWLAIGEAWDW